MQKQIFSSPFIFGRYSYNTHLESAEKIGHVNLESKGFILWIETEINISVTQRIFAEVVSGDCFVHSLIPRPVLHSGAGLGLGQRLRHHRELCFNLLPAFFPQG